jgi:hypothetical protein
MLLRLTISSSGDKQAPVLPSTVRYDVGCSLVCPLIYCSCFLWHSLLTFEFLCLSMDPLTAAMPERMGRSRDPIPNLRGEDESEITYLIHLIECKLITTRASIHRRKCFQRTKLPQRYRGRSTAQLNREPASSDATHPQNRPPLPSQSAPTPHSAPRCTAWEKAVFGPLTLGLR